MAAKQPKAKRGDGTPSRAAKSGKKAPGQTGKQDNMLEPSGLTEPHQRPEKSSHTQPPDQGPVASQPVDFPVVGLGASAGGLEALKEFLAATPGDLTAALVVLLHEDPTRASHLTEILAEYTSLPVTQIEDGGPPLPGQVHVCPPGRLLSLTRGRFQVKERKDKGSLATVDYFFHSLALEMETECAAVVLSGTGSDGSQGVRDVKQAGGLVIVQAMDSAAYGGMPQAARSTGVADFVLPPQDMPAALQGYFGRTLNLDDEAKNRERRFLEIAPKIFSQIKQRTRHDFSHYKITTLRRRVDRRMGRHQIGDYHDYVDFLRKDDEEVEKLFQELLIGVTAFFRDPKAWEILKKEGIMPRLLELEEGQTLRAWVPGCASGEEAYSLAMLIRECFEERRMGLGLQIFGTDVAPKAIERAREGRFPQSIAADLDPGRLKRFFRLENDYYLVRKELRDCLVFSEQDVMQDPPFSRLDILACRNLLIYLTPEAQHKLLPLFHYTLRPGGVLFLGTAESLGRHTKLFEVLDSKWKIYSKRQVPAWSLPDLHFPTGPLKSAQLAEAAGRSPSEQMAIQARPGLAEQTRALILDNFAPAAVVVDSQGAISYVHGRTGKYLEPASGPSDMNLFAMSREGLDTQAANLVKRAAANMETQCAEGLLVRTNGQRQAINLTVTPLDTRRNPPQFLVVFQDVDRPQKAESPTEPGDAQYRQRMKLLERELQNTRESHQVTIEKLESSNEEFKSINEELQSTNEELQSTNEELESSKEELQSMNEELTTVNVELRSKVDELAQAQGDMNNLLNSTQIATLFLDSGLNIRRFTKEAAKLINLRGSDVGRPLQDLTTRLEYDGLAADAQKVIDTLETIEREVKDKDGAWFRIRQMPYRTLENSIDGVVITFTNISELKAALERATAQQRYAENIVDTVREPLLVLTGDLRVLSANRSFFNFFQCASQDIEGEKIYEMDKKQWKLPELRKLLEEIIPERTSFERFVVEHDFPRIGKKRMLLNARLMNDYPEGRVRILLAMEEDREANQAKEN